MPLSAPLILSSPFVPLFLLFFCHFLVLFSSAAVSSFPSLSSASPSSSADLFDSSRMPMPSDSAFLPLSQHGFPHFPNVQSFSGHGIGTAGGAMDLETWSKNQAVQLNQQNAVVSQLAQMAPQRRNQLAREMANGNATAANELITRLMRDLAATQHGLMAFPHLAFVAEPQMPATVDPTLLGAMRTTTAAGMASPSSFDLPFSSGQSGTMPIARQIQLAHQRQLLLNGGGTPPPSLSNNLFQSGATFNPAGTFEQSNFGQFGQSFPTAKDRFQSSNALIPQNPFVGVSSADLSRPNSLFSSTAPTFSGQTQITPFSQSFLSSNNAKFSANGENERTLSAAEAGRQSTARDQLRDFGRKGGTFPTGNGKGFVADVMTMDDILGRQMATAGGGEGGNEETSRKGFNARRWRKTKEEHH